MKKADLINKLKQLQGISDDERAYLINLVNTKKKYGLVWEDKPEDVEEQLRENLPVLKEVKERAISNGEEYPNHILIEGDNLHALTALTFTHEGKIDFIYADPPYNTGAKDWRYNNDYVDAEDPYRHSKWLSFMEHRLKIAKGLLKNDGIICVTIDDYEVPRLWILMEEIFGYDNHLGTVAIRNNPKGRKTQRKVSLIHEYAIFFGKSQESKIKKIPKAPEDKTHNYKKDTNGEWYLPVNLRKQGADSLALNKKGKLSDRYYPIYYNSKTGEISTKNKYDIEIFPIDGDGNKRIWRRGIDVIEDMYKSGDLWYNKTKDGHQLYFKFRGGLDGEPPQSIWFDSKYSASEHGTQILDKILGEREAFPYPKSPFAVEDCIRIATVNPDAVILDFFAGSGTTLHSTINLNNSDNGKRRVILVTNNENGICENVTYKRSSRVIEGFSINSQIVIESSKNNNLRYFKCEFVNREPSIKNKKEITRLSTELLCIKENIYYEQKQIGGYLLNATYVRCFQQGQLYLLVIYDEDVIEQMVEVIQSVVTADTDRNTHFKVYVFSNGQYPYTEEFEEVLPYITLCALPDAIYKAYQNVLPKRQRQQVPELEEPTAEDVEISLQDEANPNLFNQAR